MFNARHYAYLNQGLSFDSNEDAVAKITDHLRNNKVIEAGLLVEPDNKTAYRPLSGLYLLSYISSHHCTPFENVPRLAFKELRNPKAAAVPENQDPLPQYVDCWVTYDLKCLRHRTQLVGFAANRAVLRTWLKDAKQRDAVSQSTGIRRAWLGLVPHQHRKTSGVGPLPEPDSSVPSLTMQMLPKDDAVVFKLKGQPLVRIEQRGGGCYIQSYNAAGVVVSKVRAELSMALAVHRIITSLRTQNNWPELPQTVLEW